jgi:hypothetical protein
MKYMLLLMIWWCGLVVSSLPMDIFYVFPVAFRHRNIFSAVFSGIRWRVVGYDLICLYREDSNLWVAKLNPAGISA